MDAYKFLIDKGFKPHSDLNYCLANGTEYFVGDKENTAAIAAFMASEDNYFIDKEGLKVMAETARKYGINKVILFTDYGVEIHSKFESPEIVGINKIEKVFSY